MEFHTVLTTSVSECPFVPLLYISGTDTLTDQMLLNLAGCITQQSDLLTLGVNGLKSELNIIRTAINDKPSIVLAAIEVLSKWRVTQPDPKKAYSTLCEALHRAEMRYFIKKALQ